MTRLPRRARAHAVLRLVAPVVFGIAAGGYVIPALLAQDWILALWAGLAALWTFLYAAHSCPPPPSRGVQCVHFIGGAQDGGQGIVATDGRDHSFPRVVRAPRSLRRWVTRMIGTPSSSSLTIHRTWAASDSSKLPSRS